MRNDVNIQERSAIATDASFEEWFRASALSTDALLVKQLVRDAYFAGVESVRHANAVELNEVRQILALV